MTAPVAELRDVQVERGGRVVLDVPRLPVAQGEILTLMGPNGAGKSTLLRVLGLLERATRGRVFLDGIDFTNHRGALARRRRIALVMQQPLLRNASAWENVATGLRFRHAGRAETRRRVDAYLEQLGIGHLAGRNARTLSGGEAQRVNLARGLVLEPDLLLLDEPFAALDEPTRQALLDDLWGILEGMRTTTVFVTHDRTEALALGGRLAVMIDGRILQVGPSDEVFSMPASEEVAAFVGVENLLTGRVASQEGGLAMVPVGSGEVTVVGEYGVGETLLMGIRPEALVLEPAPHAGAATSARNRLSGPITRIVPTGALARVVVDCGFPLVSLVTRQSVEDLGLSRGVSVHATFKATAVHVIRRGRGGR